MSRETKHRAIILKKQPYGEGDEIITIYTKDLGKLRVLAKSVKMPKSKLQQRLQALFLVDLSLSLGKLPKVLGAEVVEVFSGMRENLPAMKIAFYAIELALKFTPDEQKNEQLFYLLEEFLQFLSSEFREGILNSGLAKFKIEILDSLGLALRFPEAPVNSMLFFDPSYGGFSAHPIPGALPVTLNFYNLFLGFKNNNFKNLKHPVSIEENNQLQALLSGFIEYQLERKVKSEKYLRS